MQLPLILIVVVFLTGFLGGATIHQGKLTPFLGPGDLDVSDVITAVSFYDGEAGSSSDGVRVIQGIDFGDSYQPVNPTFTGTITGMSDGSGTASPNFGNADVNKLFRSQGLGSNVKINVSLPNGIYKVQMLFWEPYFGLTVGGGLGSRVFNIALEGKTAVSNLDLAAEHGVGSTTQAVLYKQVIYLADGSLQIDLTSVTNKASIAGIVISSAPETALGPSDVIGTDDFSGTNGALNGRISGEFFDRDNSLSDDSYIGHGGPRAAWQSLSGSPTVLNQALVTRESWAKRPYNAVTESDGAISPDSSRNARVVYYKFRMNRAPGATWGGASSMDFATERVFFGVPDAANPSSGQREFGIEVSNSPGFNGKTYSGMVAASNPDVLLVAKVDFDGDRLSLWLDPNLALPESGQIPIVTRTYTASAPSSGLSLGSGGTGDTTWDSLVAGTTWSALSRNGAYPVNDSFTMNPGGKAILPILANDSGDFKPASVTVATQPTSGTVSVLPDGSIRYAHTSGNPVTDSFIYTITGLDGAVSKPTTVTVNVTNSGRFNSSFVALPGEAPLTGFALVNAFPALSFTSPHDFAFSGNSLFVTEGDGRVWLIPDITAAIPVKTLFLDITDRVGHDYNEMAMKGIAIHPDFANNGQIYVTYNHLSGGTYYCRLSRFTRSQANPLLAPASSELILINQLGEGDFHNISTCRFGPDGYLYLGFGDDGTQEDGFNNSQRIDKNLSSSLLRIDVDKRQGNLAPNAHTAIPGSSTGSAGFSIPANNPFVGATSFNGRPLIPSKVRSEIYATGVRNPWQFNFDPVTDELWLGDVGRNSREEVNIFRAGDNGGWAWREGSLPGIRSGQLLNGAPQSAATLREPIYDYGRGGSAFEGSCVIGGIVYRGNRIPALVGKYIFADYISGNIWSLAKGTPNAIERLATEQAIASFAADPSNGDVLLLDRGTSSDTGPTTGRILRLVQTANDTSFPSTLSATNFFADLADLTPNPGAHFYDVNLRFWSDNAEKSRWFLIKNPTDTIGYSRDNPWTFPSGMVWVKHFNLELTPGNPATKRRIETRFLIKTATNSYGVTYQWNNITNGQPQTDATLVGPNGADIPLPSQTWHLPGRGECMTCHNPTAGHALSFNTRQLNRSGTLGSQPGNFLTLLHGNGYLNLNPGSPADLPHHLRPDETAYSLEARVRSYLDVNCSYCHRPGGGGGGNWDGRHHLRLDQTGLVNQPSVDAPLHPNDRLVIPGNINASILHNRAAAANGYTRMPSLGSNVLDAEGNQLLADWINQEANALTSYEKWRTSFFGSNPEGAPGLNPDGDSLTNLQEYLFRTNPFSGTTTLVPKLTVANSQTSIPLPALPGRRVTVERSTDLNVWQIWNATGNDGIPRNPATPFLLTAPTSGPQEFFRFQVSEN